MKAGLPEAMDLAEEHRGQITKWCYECSYEIHRGLGQMYVDDPRFRPATTGSPRAWRSRAGAFAANAERHGK